MKKSTKLTKSSPKKSKKQVPAKQMDQAAKQLPSPDLIIQKAESDVREAVKTMSREEARYLVDAYYEMQKGRIRNFNQLDSIQRGVDAGPNRALAWIGMNAQTMEKLIVKMLQTFAESHEMGQWALSVHGIGPVIAAALVAYLDPDRPTAGHIWSFCGLNPNSKWLGRAGAERWVGEQGDIPLEALIDRAVADHHVRRDTLVQYATKNADGEKVELTRSGITKALARRPWNAAMKTLCFKIGDSFIKVSNSDKDVYGKLFRERKAKEEAKNENGDYAKNAAEVLARTPSHAQKAWYAGCYTAAASRQIRAESDQKKRAKLERDLKGKPGSGVPMLPPGHILSRCRRYAVKQFLADWHNAAYRATHDGQAPPLPYPIAILGHAHYRQPHMPKN